MSMRNEGAPEKSRVHSQLGVLVSRIGDREGM